MVEGTVLDGAFEEAAAGGVSGVLVRRVDGVGFSAPGVGTFCPFCGSRAASHFQGG